MFKQNNILFGVILGFIAPIIALLVKYQLKGNLYLINKPLMPFFIAIAINLVLVRVLHKKELDKTSRGIMLGTFTAMLLVLVLKSQLK
jgi:hypothetical protein